MKKVLSLSIMALALIAFASTSAVACGTCGCSAKADKASAEKKDCSAKTDAEKAACATKASADKAASATKASADKASCSASTNAIKASAKSACSEADMKACADKMGVSVEECKKMCSEKGSMTMHKISIQGMTCTSCEASLTKVIEGVAGVKKVVSISHKDGSAVVCVDKSNTCTKTLTKAITDKGYKAEIIPAVATMAAAPDAKKSCAKSCSTADKAACASKDAPKKAEGTK